MKYNGLCPYDDNDLKRKGLKYQAHLIPRVNKNIFGFYSLPVTLFNSVITPLS